MQSANTEKKNIYIDAVNQFVFENCHTSFDWKLWIQTMGTKVKSHKKMCQIMQK